MTALAEVADFSGKPEHALSRRDVARWLVTVPNAAGTLPALRRELMAVGRPSSAAFWTSAEELLTRIADRVATIGDVRRWLEATGSEPTQMIGLHVWGDEDERRPYEDALYGELVEHLHALVLRGTIDPDRLLAGDPAALREYVAEQECWLGEPGRDAETRMTALLDEADEELIADWDAAEAEALEMLDELLAGVGERACPTDELRAAADRLRTSRTGRPFDLLASCGGSTELPQPDAELWLTLATGVVDPVDEPPPCYPDEELAAWYALQHVDWLCAVGELARRGVGASASSDDLARYVATSDIVGGDVEADGTDMLGHGFDRVVELWQALGAVDDRDRLTRLGWWGLPEALRCAWAATDA